MKAIQLVLTTEDTKLEISFPSVLELAALSMTTNRFIEILLVYADEKVHDIEQEERNKNFWNSFKKTNRGLYE